MPGPLTLLAAGAAVGAAAAICRRRIRATFERLTDARFPVGADGIIPGASAIVLPASGPRGVLVLHGFGDTPQTVRYLAEYLHAAGLGVRAPLLPGHGRRLADFARSGGTQWLAEARDSLVRLRAEHAEVAIVGVSMGGALATLLAAHDRRLPALVLLAPYLSMPRRLRVLAATGALWGWCVPYVAGRGERSIHDTQERSRSLAYGVTTPRLVAELGAIARRALAAAPRVTAPTLMVQSCEDHRIPPEAARRVFAALGAPEKVLEWIDGCGHVITVDHGRERVFARVREWLDGHWRARGESTAERTCRVLRTE
ncbi:MAG TPA: alpha/beta fold hydrolase [Gemmatimonadaceae bacterium]|nr:alpha/beta fold hydrolase [Gemmatimonadaceae bacterium]